MSSKTFDLKIIIDENRKVEVKNLTDESVSKVNFMDFYFIPYLSANLESAITSLISQMIQDELQILFEKQRKTKPKKLEIDKKKIKTSEDLLRDLTSKYQKTVRIRLKKNKDYLVAEELKGRKLNESELINERHKFCDEFAKICDELQMEKKKLIITNIAQKMFRQNSNYHLTFKRKLNDLCWNFQDVKDGYLESRKQRISEIAEPPICLNCQHKINDAKPGFRCAAFPGGIPAEIIASVADHREPYRKDGGIMYEPINDDFRLPSNLGFGTLPNKDVFL